MITPAGRFSFGLWSAPEMPVMSGIHERETGPSLRSEAPDVRRLLHCQKRKDFSREQLTTSFIHSSTFSFCPAGDGEGKHADRVAKAQSRIYCAIHMPKWKVVLPTGLLWLVAVLWGAHSLLKLPSVGETQDLPAAQSTVPEKRTLLIMVDPKLTGCADYWREADHVRN